MQDDTPGRKIDLTIGASLKELGQSREQSARRLAEQSGISAAMVSRIENGLVSPSVDTLAALAALADALEVPIVSLFREARTGHTDYTLVRHGQGLKSTRLAGGHTHEYVNLALHSRKDLRFQARRVILLRDEGRPAVRPASPAAPLHGAGGLRHARRRDGHRRRRPGRHP